MSVLLSQLIILLFVLHMQVFELFDIAVEFFLFLLDSLMVHLVEIAFFEQLVVCGFGFLSYNHCFVELALQALDLLAEVLVLDVGVWDLAGVVSLSTFLDDLIPLLLQ